MRVSCTLVFVVFFSLIHAQKPSNDSVLEKFGFVEYQIPIDKDTVYFYLRKSLNDNPNKIVLYLQGSSADPLFTVAKEKEGYKEYRWFPGDYNFLDDSYAYAVIAKKGINGIIDEDNLSVPKVYHKANSLDYRVLQANVTLNYIISNILTSSEKVIVYGHSEGAPVAAKLATINSKITHLGFWAGHIFNEHYDFMLMRTHMYQKGQINADELSTYVKESIEDLKLLRTDSLNTNVKDGYTNKRWWSYSEPVFNHLIQLDIPIFFQVATNDRSSPIESSYMLPLEFARLGKTNLSYNICVDCDHGFIRKVKKKQVDLWSRIFQDFIKWSEK